MKTVSLFVGVLLLALIGAMPTPSAHHAFAGQYDANQLVTLKGTVTRVAWINPHAHLYVDVTDGGTTVAWDFELGSPNALIRRGWSANTVKTGDVITVSGYRARDGSNLANARSVVLSDGRSVFAGSSIGNDGSQ